MKLSTSFSLACDLCGLKASKVDGLKEHTRGNHRITREWRGKNKDIKQSHTFRRRLDMGELFNVLLNMVKEWSEEDQKLLEAGRTGALHGEKDSLSLKTEGYQWYKTNKSKSDRIIRINPGEKYSVNDSVTNFWAVSSSSDTTGKTLKENAKERMRHRKLPEVSSFDEYVSMRSSCWILEEVDGEFYCDCPVGMKVSILLHVLFICDISVFF